MNHICLLPSLIDSHDVDQDYLQMSYQLVSNITGLKGQHPLIPSFVIRNFTMNDLIQSGFPYYQEHELSKIKDYFLKKDHQAKMNEKLEEFELETMYLESYINERREIAESLGIGDQKNRASSLSESHMTAFKESMIQRESFYTLPIVILDLGEALSPRLVHENIRKQNHWIIQIIQFLNFLLENHWVIHKSMNLTIEDFGFDRSGKVVYFQGFGKLTRTYVDDHSNLALHMKSIEDVLNSYYALFYKDLAMHNNPTLDNVYRKLISSAYTDLPTLIKDIHGKWDKRQTERKIYVFIDFANIFISLNPLKMGQQYLKIKLDFDKFFLKLFGVNYKQKIRFKYAPIFEKTIENERELNDTVLFLQEAKDYLAQYEITSEFVRNGTKKAKIQVNGSEEDVDDQALIRKMEQNIEVADSILLMSGDKHYLDIVQKYRDKQKHVKVVALAEATSKKLIEYVDDFQCITDFADCFYYEEEGLDE